MRLLPGIDGFHLFPCSASSELIPCVPGAQERFHCLCSPRAFSDYGRFSCRVPFHAWPWQMLESSPSALGVLFAAAALPSPGQRALHQPRMLYEPPSRPLTQGRARLRGWNMERALSSVKITCGQMLIIGAVWDISLPSTSSQALQVLFPTTAE